MNTNLKRTVIILLSGLIAAPVLAQTTEHHNVSRSPWSITASMGMGNFQYMEGTHGQTALGRFAFDYALNSHLGIEVGIQNGNHMRFALPHETVAILGGVPVEGATKPLLDLLVTAKTPHFNRAVPLYGLIKGGVAYRQLEIDRETVNDLTKIAPEVQAGIGYKVNKHLDVGLVYQYVAGKNPNVQADALTETGKIVNIPTQQAVLLGLTFTLE
jgi:opacity protein-like surface antigen